MKLMEVLKGSSAIQIEWHQLSKIKRVGEFNIGGTTFGVVFLNYDTSTEPQLANKLTQHYSTLLVSFGVKIGPWKYSHKMRGDSPFPAQVLNTIITAIKQELKPGQLLCFVAKHSEDEAQDFEHRKKFYTRMVAVYERQGWHKHILTFNKGSMGFFLFDRPINPKDLNQMFKALGHKVDK